MWNFLRKLFERRREDEPSDPLLYSHYSDDEVGTEPGVMGGSSDADLEDHDAEEAYDTAYPQRRRGSEGEGED